MSASHDAALRASARRSSLAQSPYPIQRITAALAALALALSLLMAAPALRAASYGAGAPGSHQIGTGDTPIGAVPSAPERTRFAPHGPAVVLTDALAAPRAQPPAELTSALAGGTPAALSRWRLAHATSTSIP